MTASRILRFAAAALLTAAGIASAQPVRPDDAPDARMTPEQRRELWQRMTPEQREQWRRSRSPEERRELWMRMTPEQRGAMRERWMEERRRRMDDGVGPAMGERMPPHRLTPEERQRLRDQIREANREWRGKGMHGPRGQR
ncbi:MAG: hypothetical protein AB1761_04030 [Pseudomonadota bacterium]